jgi:hypothetical protein
MFLLSVGIYGFQTYLKGDKRHTKRAVSYTVSLDIGEKNINTAITNKNGQYPNDREVKKLKIIKK